MGSVVAPGRGARFVAGGGGPPTALTRLRLARYALAFICVVVLSAAQDFLFTRPLEFLHQNSPTPQKYLLETMGGGVALLDYDGDGRLDVFLVNGGHLPGPFHRENSKYWNRLFRNNSNGTFTDVTVAAGLHHAGNVYGMGASAADFDNDGHTDLYVTNFGANQLFHNNGNGTFTDITVTAGVAAAGWSVSAAFLDYDNDGRLDLFVARYLDWDLGRSITCGTPFNAYCRPDKFPGTTNLLFHNEGAGRFRDVSTASGITAFVGKGMGVAVNDFDADGFPDIFVANDGMEQFLFHNEHGTRFREVALEAGVALNDNAQTFAGMGAAFADYDNDGKPDLLVTNLALEKYALYRQEDAGQFAYTSLTSGLAALTSRSSGWGVGLHDFDNDGWKDAFVAQSHVLDNVERIHSGLRYLEPPALYRNVRGHFQAQSLTGASPVAGRGAAFGDLDNDGTVDVVLPILGGRPLVLMNRGAAAGVTIRLIGVRGNRDGAGAIVRSGTQTVYATSAGSYLSANDTRIHLAAPAGPISVEILWPGGHGQTVRGIPVSRVTTIREKIE